MIIGFSQRLRGLGPAILLYFVTIALVGFAVDGGIYSILLNLFLVRLGYGPELIGLVNSAGTLTFALSSLPAGALGQRWGSRRMMPIGLGFMIAGCILLPLADALAPALQLPWLMVNEVILYFGLALYFVNTAPYLMEVVSAERRNSLFSFQTALASLSAFAGSLAGGFLPTIIGALLGISIAQAAPYRYALIVAGLALIPALLAIRAARPVVLAHQDTPVDLAAAARRPAVVAPIFGLLATIALVRVLQVSGLAVTSTFFNVYLDSALLVPTAQIGAAAALARLLGVPAALSTALLTARFGNRTVVIWASLGTALSLLPIALVTRFDAASLSLIGVVALSPIRYAASLVYFLELVPPARRATVSGIMETAAGICFTILTFGGGYMIALLGYRSLFLTGALLSALSALVFWLCFRGRAAAR